MRPEDYIDIVGEDVIADISRRCASSGDPGRVPHLRAGATRLLPAGISPGRDLADGAILHRPGGGDPQAT